MTSNSVTAATWKWRADPTEPVEPPVDLGGVRKRGVIQALIGGVICLLIFLFLSKTVAYIGWSIASIVFLSAMLSPGGAFAAIERGIGHLAFGVGWLMTWLLMTPVFYLFFVPFRFLFRVGKKKDKLLRECPSSENSYWVDRSNEEFKPENYRRQF